MELTNKNWIALLLVDKINQWEYCYFQIRRRNGPMEAPYLMFNRIIKWVEMKHKSVHFLISRKNCVLFEILQE